jgi:hypothetical protein
MCALCSDHRHGTRRAPQASAGAISAARLMLLQAVAAAGDGGDRPDQQPVVDPLLRKVVNGAAGIELRRRLSPAGAASSSSSSSSSSREAPLGRDILSEWLVREPFAFHLTLCVVAAEISLGHVGSCLTNGGVCDGRGQMELLGPDEEAADDARVHIDAMITALDLQEGTVDEFTSGMARLKVELAAARLLWREGVEEG